MSNKVTYGEIVEALSRKTGFSKQKSEDFTKALISRVQQELEETGKASITNFGSFKVKEVAERQGQNPQTGEPITIPAHKRVSFTPYKALRKRVNAKYAHLESKVIDEPVASESVSKSEESATDSTSPIESIPNESDQKSRNIKYADRRKGTNTGLMIAAVLMLVVIAIVSLWFVLSSGKEKVASDEPAIEQPQTPEAAAQLIEAETELSNDEPQNSPPLENEASDFDESSEMNDPQINTIESESDLKPSVENTSETSTYTVKQDEWYWIIARQVYGKERFWPIIFMYNSSHGVHPDSLEEGIKLKVPPLEGSANNPTKRDLRLLAEASEIVAEAYRQNGRTDKADEYARFADKWAKMAQ
jgi:DNA-binding protein HU-beta